MYKKTKNKKILTVFLALALVVSCGLGFFQLRHRGRDIYTALQQSFTSSSAARLDINRTLARQSHQGDSSRQAEGEGEREEKASGSFLLLLAGLAFVTGPGSAAFLVALVLFSSATVAVSLYSKGISSMRERLRRYRLRCLQFLTPVQQSMLSRADEYDINPIRTGVGFTNPCFVVECRARVFFMDQIGSHELH